MAIVPSVAGVVATCLHNHSQHRHRESYFKCVQNFEEKFDQNESRRMTADDGELVVPAWLNVEDTIERVLAAPGRRLLTSERCRTRASLLFGIRLQANTKKYCRARDIFDFAKSCAKWSPVLKTLRRGALPTLPCGMRTLRFWCERWLY